MKKILVLATLIALQAVSVAQPGRLSPQGGTVTGVLSTSGGGISVTGTVAQPSVGLLTSCASNDFLKWSGSAWACSAGNGITGSGTINFVPRWSSGSTLGNSSITDNGGGNVTTTSTVTIGVASAPTTIHASSTLFPSTAPKVEVLTGTAVGAYNEAFVIRHANVDATAVTRRLGLLIQLSTEGTLGEHSKEAGFLAESAGAFANGVSLHLVTNDAKQMTIDSSGNTGMGITGPLTKLHVRASGSGLGTPTAGTVITTETNSDSFITIEGGSANSKGILFANSSSMADGGIIYDAISRNLQLRTAGNTTRLTLDSNGLATFANGLTSIAAINTLGRTDHNVETLAFTTNTTATLGANTRILALTHTGDATIQGLTGGSSGRRITIYNDSSSLLLISRDNGTATAGNRFTGPTIATNFTIDAQATEDLVYSGSQSRWILDQHLTYDFLGIGAAPEANGPLSFAAAVGNKIQLYPINSTTQYGFGIQSAQMQIYTPTTSDKVSIGFGDSDSFTEVAAFAGTAGITTTRSVHAGDGNNDEFEIRGNLNSTQSAPTLSSCGTSPSITGTASNNWGTFATGTGATGCTITFSSSFSGGTVSCVVMPLSNANPNPSWSTSVTALTLSSAVASSSYSYFCGCAGTGCQ